ncbi:DNA-binding protein [Streptococcus agalactiae]|uniref:DNA-binding protein n=2 Tax=Streptococcus agalactiae TaxID=1311 RepID=UPI000E063DAF|nr:DNA-binding protein [Streptococcus agalactiae]SUN26709.1 phage protein [Streptococcus agalactiae]
MSIEESLKVTIEDILTSLFAEKVEVLNLDHAFPPVMTQSAAMKWLRIGNDSLQYYIDKGMPVIKNESGSIKIPRDAVVEWFKTDWRKLS